MTNQFPSKRVLTLAVVAAALSACSMTPQYVRPELPVGNRLVEKDMNVIEREGETTDVPWREFYLDTTLQQLAEKALRNNRDLRVAALNVEQVQAQYRIQRAELLPGVAATASGSRQRVAESVSQTGEAYIANQYNVGLGLASWELDLFGRVNSLRQGALEQYLASVEARRSVQLSLLAQVGETYLAWVANSKLLELSADTLDRHQATYERVQRRHAQGLSSSLELSQAQSAVHSARADMALYQRQLQQSRSALELLVGSPLEAQQPAGDILTVDFTADVPAQLDSQVLLQRPDILQAEHTLRAANANIGAARAAFFPRVALTASAGSASSELDGLFDSGTGVWSFSPQISLPIFMWGANRAALDVAKLRQESSVAQYERAIQVAFKEARDGLQGLDTLADQFAAQRDLVAAAQRTLDLANIRYEKGVDSFLEVLVAQRSLNAAQQGLVGIRLAQLRNRINLFRALGGGSATLDSDITNAAPTFP